LIHPGHLRSLAGRPVLVALDGGPCDAAVTRAAAQLAAAHGARPHAVHALGPVPHPHAGRALEAHLVAALGTEHRWPVRAHLGPPAAVIARRAAELDAALVVLGIRHHGPLHRVLHDETTLHVMRDTTCPVLAVTPSFVAPPRRVMVGVDFGVASMHAARAALHLLDPAGTLVVAYVEPMRADADPDEALEPDGVVYALGVEAALDRLVIDLAAPPTVHVEPLRVVSDTASSVGEALLAAADRARVDLLAVGSRRHDWADRVLLGSVTQDLARDGRHALLVVPPTPARPGAQRLDG
jgi:nucleotide-binding universal stress UspA family protein